MRTNTLTTLALLFPFAAVAHVAPAHALTVTRPALLGDALEKLGALVGKPTVTVADPTELRLPPPPPDELGGPATPPGATDGRVARPPEVLSTGFFVKDGVIYDPNGEPFVMRGFNHTHWWGDQAGNLAAVEEFPKTHANAVRVVFGPDFGAETPAEKREVVERYIENGIVPVVEEHRGTCGHDPEQIREITDVWLEPENRAWLIEHERHVILNIANEWGPSDADVWADAYQESITRLRAAGIHNMLVIDAGGSCGQNPRTILARGRDLLEADPERNVAFDLHMYAFWRTDGATDVGSWGSTGAPWDVRTELLAIEGEGLALIIGEIAWDGIDIVEYDTREVLGILEELGMGWLAWSWNQNSGSGEYDLRAGSPAYTYEGPSSLTPGGRLFLLDPDYGIEATSIPSSAFTR
jgi:mannan endo-1,4-beta-mannosidase